MQTKGAMEINVGTFVTIVLLMSVLILGLMLVKSVFDKPEFKIYKDGVEVDYLFVSHTGKAYYEQDLTMKWLDENCELSLSAYNQICQEHYDEKCDIGEEDCIDWDYYECEEYIVEVLK